VSGHSARRSHGRTPRRGEIESPTIRVNSFAPGDDLLLLQGSNSLRWSFNNNVEDLRPSTFTLGSATASTGTPALATPGDISGDEASKAAQRRRRIKAGVLPHGAGAPLPCQTSGAAAEQQQQEPLPLQFSPTLKSSHQILSDTERAALTAVADEPQNSKNLCHQPNPAPLLPRQLEPTTTGDALSPVALSGLSNSRLMRRRQQKETTAACAQVGEVHTPSQPNGTLESQQCAVSTAECSTASVAVGSFANSKLMRRRQEKETTGASILADAALEPSQPSLVSKLQEQVASTAESSPAPVAFNSLANSKLLRRRQDGQNTTACALVEEAPSPSLPSSVPEPHQQAASTAESSPAPIAFNSLANSKLLRRRQDKQNTMACAPVEEAPSPSQPSSVPEPHQQAASTAESSPAPVAFNSLANSKLMRRRQEKECPAAPTQSNESPLLAQSGAAPQTPQISPGSPAGNTPAQVGFHRPENSRLMQRRLTKETGRGMAAASCGLSQDTGTPDVKHHDDTGTLASECSTAVQSLEALRPLQLESEQVLE